ncbi:SDR family NAD(P)-dependent oxidoreductase [Planococcus sp. X10-3]|uniref:SDR family NAD(P)-dependent oxidoreductase n=1 Tax=Planococcus sp. X10-3 TaxID=3061240 RepID=UPI003BB0D406
MKLGLEGKVVIVTGGSKGIGLETAKGFAEEGAKIVICSRNIKKLEEAAEYIKKSTGVDITYLPVDVTKLDEIQSFVNTVMDQFGRIDILVNNAGTGTYKPFLEVTDEELQYGMDINFFAQFRFCQRIIPIMVEQGSGSIINVSGSTGINICPEPFFASCTGPAKSAEIRFTKNIAREFGKLNIRVNCIIPGLVDTPERFGKWEQEMAKKNLSAEEAEEVKKSWAPNNSTPNNRWGTPEEIANLIVFTASDRSSYINGAVLVADGGQDKS